MLYIPRLGRRALSRDNQNSTIQEAINTYLERGIKDKQDIYTRVVDDLGVPRPTVRRVARELRNELLRRIEALQEEITASEGGSRPK